MFRILFTLEVLGYVRQNPQSRAYALTEQIGWLTDRGIPDTLRRAARPSMGRLLTRFEQTVNLAILDRDQPLYIEIMEGLRSVRMAATVNTYAPIHATAVGKAMLAFLDPVEAEQILKKRPLSKFTENTTSSIRTLVRQLDRIRGRGYAIDNEETETGARCVAAPIFNSQGRPIAAISISGPISHVKGKPLQQMEF